MSEAPPPHTDAAWSALFGAWLVATIASLGSMFFSQVMDLPPCSLCWYQRIFMFPLPIVLLAGLLPYDRRAWRYGLPLALIGSFLGLWHTLLYAGILPESAAPCTSGVPCGQQSFELFGFLSIPLLSLLAFLTISALLLLARARSK